MLDVYMRQPLPCETEGGSVKAIIEIWPSEAGVMPDGSWNNDAWEESITYLELHGGKEVFKEFWRKLRMQSKRFGGFSVFSLTGQGEPVPLP
ncbi:MAG: hypothetical protein DELT_02550 [Desulfovibrio sp.]